MGSTFARDLAGDESLPLGAQISIHLNANHYPPVPQSMVEPCIKAIEAFNAGDWYKLIKLPEGITFKGESSAPAEAIVENHHLVWWLDPQD